MLVESYKKQVCAEVAQVCFLYTFCTTNGVMKVMVQNVSVNLYYNRSF